MGCFGRRKSTVVPEGSNEPIRNVLKKKRKRSLRLPALTGPFKDISFVDIEFGDSIYARLYYPSIKAPLNAKQARWIPSPPYYASYGNFIGMPWIVSQLITRYLASSARIPAYEGLELLKDQFSTLPLIIMSHGLGAFRTTYSAVCTQLASHGHLVAAIEHRDGSAALTLTNRHTVAMPYKHPERKSPYDARQFNDKKMARAIGEHTWRSSQLHKRVEEVKKLLSILLREQTCGSWSPSGERHKDILNHFLNSIDRQRVYAAGHSFGACTAMAACSQESRFQACIALDPWMFPLPDNDQWVERPFPLIIINSYTFQWAENLHSLRSLIHRIEYLRQDSGNTPVAQFTLMGSTHQEFGDFPCLISPRLIRRFRGHAGEIDPEMAIHVSVATSLRFIHQLDHKLGQGRRIHCKCMHPDNHICNEGDQWCQAKATASKVFESVWSPTFHPTVDDLLSVDHISL